MSTVATGALLSSQPIMMALVASPAGALSDRIGARGLAVTGMSLLGVGLLGLSSVDGSSSALTIGLWYLLSGFGVGIFVSPNTSAAMGAAPANQQGLAGGLLALSRISGMLLGVAAATTIFEGAGGQTGGTWGPTEFSALHLALKIAAAHALVAAFASALRGGHKA
jgi:MFS family permease